MKFKYLTICLIAINIQSAYADTGDEENNPAPPIFAGQDYDIGACEPYMTECTVNGNPKFYGRELNHVNLIPENNIEFKQNLRKIIDFGDVHNITIKTKDDMEANSISLRNHIEVAGDNGNPTVLNKSGLNMNGKIISGLQDGAIEANSKEAVNGGQIFDLLKRNQQGSGNQIQLNSGNNIQIQKSNTDEYTIATTDRISVKSIAIDNKVMIDNQGINGGGEKVTNIADGEISATSTDAITGRQLFNAMRQNPTDYRLAQRLDESIHKTELLKDELSSAIAASNAMAGLTQDSQYGTNMLSIGVGGYSNKQAIAIGVSGVTDNGKWTYRLNGAVGINKGHHNQRFSYSSSIGYQF